MLSYDDDEDEIEDYWPSFDGLVTIFIRVKSLLPVHISIHSRLATEGILVL
jgi:hypothetical protein